MKKITKDDLYIQNNYIDDILENPENFDTCEILFFSLLTPYKYKLYDYVLLNYGMDEDSDIFKDFLIKYGIYDDYVNKVCTSNDVLLKANLVMFLENELFTPIFDNIPNFIEKVTNYEEHSAKNKLCVLTALSSYKCSDDDINQIKKSVKKLILNDEEFKNEFSKDELKKIIDTYSNQIDNNHEEVSGKTKIYINY